MQKFVSFAEDDLHSENGGSECSDRVKSRKGARAETYSAKVFVGGLPPDIDETEILTSFHVFGRLSVDWPGRDINPSYMFPPKGYVFLFFELEKSVHQLIKACYKLNGCLYYRVSSPSLKNKMVQVRPWKISNAFFVNESIYFTWQFPVFVGGLPRTMTSAELAVLAEGKFGSVSFAGVFTDSIWHYPRGYGFVFFPNFESYTSSIMQRYVAILSENKVRVHHIEFKPFVGFHLPTIY